MPNNQKNLLRRLNPLLDLNFSNISIDHSSYHAVAAWPVNILALVLSDNGKGSDYYENLVGGQHLPILANHVYFIPCGLRMRFEESDGREVISLHFNLSFFHGIDLFSGSSRCETFHDPELVSRFLSILNSSDELKAICELKMEVARICLAYWPEAAGQITPSMLKYEPAFQRIRENLDAHLNVKMLADTMGIRQNVFSRNFSRDIGRPPKDILQDELLKRVSSALLLPGATIRKVAKELKFSSEFYMSRFFKKRTGMSPSEYQAKFRR